MCQQTFTSDSYNLWISGWFTITTDINDIICSYVVNYQVTLKQQILEKKMFNRHELPYNIISRYVKILLKYEKCLRHNDIQ